MSLCVHPGGKDEITTEPLESVNVTFNGFDGDSHSGLTRESCVRVKKQYKVGTTIRNTRQISIVSAEELQLIANAMNLPGIQPEWLGANLCISGIPDLTKIPPSARLLFSSGASLVVDVENEPCKYPAEIIEKHHPGFGKSFVKSAVGMRGVTAWVERQGTIRQGDGVEVHVPLVRAPWTDGPLVDSPLVESPGVESPLVDSPGE